MKTRFMYKKTSGQSIVLIAIILVVLFGMVGLAVDVGNTYAEQRSLVRATNAAALAGMKVVTETKGGSDAAVAKAIEASFRSNGITIQTDPSAPVQPGQRRVIARYLKADGTAFSCYIGNCGSTVPQGTNYIQIQSEGDVSTYFARVVGQANLPVNTQAYAAQCLPSANVFPIAVRASALDANGFKKPTIDSEKPFYKKYADPNFPKGKWQRRLFIKPNFNDPGGFNYLRWRANAGTDLAAMFAGDGNIDEGFEEVAEWPDTSSPKPDGYPLEPNQLSLGDWLWGYEGNVAGGGVSSALTTLKNNRTALILPIVSGFTGSGSEAKFEVKRLGVFYLLGVGPNYLDLVYLNEANQVPCLRAPVEQTGNLGLQGEVWLRPRWRENAATDQPIAYQIVMDASGSMSWNFTGYGTKNGKDYQCENPNNLGNTLPFNDDCHGGPDSAWRNVNERRVTVAKKAISDFIDGMDTYDKMRIVVFTTALGGANAKAYPSDGWSNDKGMLKDSIRAAGAYNGDPYRTAGGTPGPQAIQRVRQLLDSQAPKVAENGQEFKYVTIYLTDGVANVFLNGSGNDARDIPECAAMTPNAARNTAKPCQVGKTASGVLRPITAMIDQADQMKRKYDNMSLYVVAMAGVDTTGLGDVASEPSMVYEATRPDLVSTILGRIKYREDNVPCRAAGNEQWIDRIPPANSVGHDGTEGFVTLRSQGGKPLPPGLDKLPIRHDPKTGRLTYSVPPPDGKNPGIPPGIYQVEAYVQYKGPDNVTRRYDLIVDPVLNVSKTTSFEISPISFGKIVTVDPLFLALDPAVDVCTP